MADYNFIISNQIETITALEKKLSRTQIVKVSFYHPASRGINSDEDPTKTAIMRKPIAGRTVAISDELFEDGWLGHKVYIDGLGVFIAEDRMDDSITGKQIDICVKSRNRAITLGIIDGVIAVKL